MSSARLSAPVTIAAVLNLEHAHGQGVLRGIARAVNEHPDVLLLRFSHTRLQDRPWLNALEADGLVVKVTTPAEAAMLERTARPVIDVGAECADHSLVRVTADNLAVGDMAAGHFLRRGFRCLGYVGIGGHGASQLRLQGFRAASEEAGLPCAVLQDAFDRPELLQRRAVAGRLRRWLESLPVPAGIFCSDDVVGSTVANLCLAIGRPVPGEVAVLGCNNDPTEIHGSKVELSSIDLNSERIGYDAARLLVAWLRERRRPPAATLLQPLKIVTRRSTECFAVPDEAVLQALEFIHDRVAGTFSVPDVARAAGISRRLLEMRFRKHLGYSIYAEVQRVRLERATQLMADASLRLADVARAAGFSSAAKFSAVFREHHRASPTQFRRIHFLGGWAPEE